MLAKYCQDCGKENTSRYADYCKTCWLRNWRKRKTTQDSAICSCGGCSEYVAHSLGQAAWLLKVSRAAAQNMTRRGLGVQIDGRWHFTQAELATPRKSGRPRKE